MPSAKFASQLPLVMPVVTLQLIPAGLLVTVPLPSPLAETSRLFVR
jgi:hypothetical protein